MIDQPDTVAQSANDADPPSRASPGLEVAGQFSDTTSGLSFLHRAWRRISNKESTQVVNGQLGSAEDSQLLMSAGDKPFNPTGQMQMPSPERSRVLLDLYFDFCIATYRLLHRPTVEAWVIRVNENAQLNLSLFEGTYSCNQVTCFVDLEPRYWPRKNSSGPFNIRSRDLSRRKGQRGYGAVT